MMYTCLTPEHDGSWAEAVIGPHLSGNDRDVRTIMVNLMPPNMAAELMQQRISDAFSAAQIVPNTFN